MSIFQYNLTNKLFTITFKLINYYLNLKQKKNQDEDDFIFESPSFCLLRINNIQKWALTAGSNKKTIQKKNMKNYDAM